MQLFGESVVAVSGTQWDFDFRALPGNRTNWVPKWGFKTEAPTFDPRFDIGGQFGGWHYGVKAYGGYGEDLGSNQEAKRGPNVNEYYCDFAGVFGTGIFVTGVAGTSVNNIGVYGQLGEGPVGDFLAGGVVGAAFQGAGNPWLVAIGLGRRRRVEFRVGSLGLFGTELRSRGLVRQSRPVNFPRLQHHPRRLGLVA
jgi:hypothetical protein